MSDEPRVRTLEDITREIEFLAFHGEGTEKLRALKMLQEARGGSSITLPEPLNRAERRARLARLMKAQDQELCRLAFSDAFPHQGDSLGDRIPTVTDSDLSPEDEARALRCKTVRLIYREWPKLKRSGQPPGFPRGTDAMTQTGWCQEFARKIIRGEIQSRAASATFLASLKPPDAPQV